MDNFQNWLYEEYSDNIPSKVIKVLENEDIPTKWIIPAARIIHRLSEMPWYSQEKLAKETSLNKVDLICLNSLIRKSDFLQEMIVHNGLGRKYWNTIIPYAKS